jgi:hypothetical protein
MTCQPEISEPEPDPFRRNLFLMWVTLCWLATLALLVLSVVWLSVLIFFCAFLPTCAYAVAQTKRWFIPDEVEYWKQQALRKTAGDWLASESDPSRRHVAEEKRLPSEESIKEAQGLFPLQAPRGPTAGNQSAPASSQITLERPSSGEPTERRPSASEQPSLGRRARKPLLAGDDPLEEIGWLLLCFGPLITFVVFIVKFVDFHAWVQEWTGSDRKGAILAVLVVGGIALVLLFLTLILLFRG